MWRWGLYSALKTEERFLKKISSLHRALRDISVEIFFISKLHFSYDLIPLIMKVQNLKQGEEQQTSRSLNHSVVLARSLLLLLLFFKARACFEKKLLLPDFNFGTNAPGKENSKIKKMKRKIRKFLPKSVILSTVQ